MLNKENWRVDILKPVVSALASVALSCALSAPAYAAEVLTIELEAVFGPLGSWSEGDAPNSVDIEPGDTLSFVAVLTGLENKGLPTFRFTPTLLEATAVINGSTFTFGNVNASTRASSDLEFDVIGNPFTTDFSDFELQGSGPLLEGGIFTELTFRNDRTDFSDIISLAELIPYLLTDRVSISIFESIISNEDGGLSLSGGVIFGAEITSLVFTLSDTEVVPLPAAFPLMAGGLALFGCGGAARRRNKR